MSDVAEVKSGLRNAAKEMGRGYDLAGEARSIVGSSADVHRGYAGLLNKLIATFDITQGRLSEAKAKSEESKGIINVVRNSLGPLALETSSNEALQRLPKRVDQQLDNQTEYGFELEGHRKIAAEFKQRIELLRDDLIGWCDGLKEDGLENGQYREFSDTVNAISDAAY